MRTYKEWKKAYGNYKKMYNAANRLMKKKYGHGLADEKLNYRNWKNLYTGEERVKKTMQKEGLRGKSLNINRDIVNQQKYNISLKQGRALAKAKRNLLRKELKIATKEKAKTIRQQLKEISVEGIRAENIDYQDLKNVMENINQDLKLDTFYADAKEGSYRRQRKIAYIVFGSGEDPEIEEVVI